VRFVKSKRAPAGHFAAVRYAVLGIGDTNYDQYQAIPRLIDVHLDKLGTRERASEAASERASDASERARARCSTTLWAGR
jgi:sulfite reductase alpha subunit-like flavoprotein